MLASAFVIFVAIFPSLAVAWPASQLEARAFGSSVVCVPGTYDWTDNHLGSSPCDIAGRVYGVCAGTSWNVQPLKDKSHYDPPMKVNNTVNRCSCSWAAYNLMQACTLCQGIESSIIPWTSWTEECGDKVSTTYFPADITLPEDTYIPAYAAQDPTKWDGKRFNLQEAKAIHDNGDPDLLQGNPSTGKSSSPIGAIVGGVVGGVVVIVSGCLVALFMYRKKQKRATMSGPSMMGHSRNNSDVSQKSTGTGTGIGMGGIGLGYQRMDQSYITTSPSPPPPMSPMSGTLHTHASSVGSLSYFGSMNHANSIVGPYGSPSPPPGRAMSPASLSPPPTTVSPSGHHPHVVPFTLAPTPEAISREASHADLLDRKRADGAMIPPVYDPSNNTSNIRGATTHHHHQHSRGDSGGAGGTETPNRRLPPAYSALDAASHASHRTGSRPLHEKKGSSDSQHSLTSNTSGDTMTPVRQGHSHNPSHIGDEIITSIDDVLMQIRDPPTHQTTGNHH